MVRKKRGAACSLLHEKPSAGSNRTNSKGQPKPSPVPVETTSETTTEHAPPPINPPINLRYVCSVLGPRPLLRLVDIQGLKEHFLGGLCRLGPRLRVRVEHSPVENHPYRLPDALVASCLRQRGQPFHPVVFEQFSGVGLGLFPSLVLWWWQRAGEGRGGERQKKDAGLSWF